MNMMKVTHVHAVYEKKDRVLRYFRLRAEGLTFFVLIPISHKQAKLCRNLVKILFI